MKEAMLYDKKKGKIVQCKLCNRRCAIPDGGRGFCRVRENREGVLYSLVYGKACSYTTDPIEKKPFYHFMPGTNAFSFATVGCNFRCQHCQNWEISQAEAISGYDISPEGIVKLALRDNADGIAYTYTEPTVFFEYAYDTAEIARKQKLYSVFVTNGYMTKEAIDLMGKIDASRIDLKAFTDKFYKEICGGASLEHVLESIKLLRKRQHIEIITLLIPTLNDSDDELRALGKWVADLDKNIPLHFTAYYPAYKMSIPPTPLSTLERARRIAIDEGVRYVYTGNIPGGEGENTYCPNCRGMLIKRYGFSVLENKVRDGKCPSCGEKIPVVTSLGWD